MNRRHRHLIKDVVATALPWAVVLVALGGCATGNSWSQWGGPDRNFMVESGALADVWPEDGPTRLWHRELGDGYSTILVDQGVLYTMYRVDDDEFTVALSADTGETIWQHKNASPFTSLMAQFGPGPHSTPVIDGNRLYTIGTNTVMHCFDKTNGKVLWKRDLAGEFGAPVPRRGYACSPIAYRGTIIVPVDRKRDDRADSENKANEAAEGQSLMAFDGATGAVVWRTQDYPVTHSSPILIKVGGEDQLVMLMRKEMIGVDPAGGELLWHQPFTPAGSNLATPLWTGDDLLFCSSAYDSGSRVVKLTKSQGKTEPEQLWYSRKMRIHHGNAIRIGDYVYGSSGNSGSAFFMGMNIRTGKVAWRKRGLKKATCVYGDGKLIILDEEGEMSLATVTPEGLTIHSHCTVAERYAWAAPTLVGTKLYVRDRKHIMAFDLG